MGYYTSIVRTKIAYMQTQCKKINQTKIKHKNHQKTAPKTQ